MTSDVLAIRGERLVLARIAFSGRDQRPEAFHTEILRIAEIDADERIAAYVAFDLEDFDAAIAELDARYLAGEGAPTFSGVVRRHKGLRRRSTAGSFPRQPRTSRTATTAAQYRSRPASLSDICALHGISV